MRILFDVDGVVADFVSPCLRWLGERGRPAAPEDVIDPWIATALDLPADLADALYAWVAEPGWAEQLVPYPGAVEAVMSLAAEHEVVFVTKPYRPSRTWTADRDRWLVDHFGSLGESVVHTAHKHVVHGEILVEDDLDHAVRWLMGAPAPASEPIIWSRPWNRRGPPYRRVTSWEELDETIREIAWERGERRP